MVKTFQEKIDMGKCFGDILKELRLEKGKGIRKFAEILKMDFSKLSNIERGLVAPPQDISFLKRIVYYLDLDSFNSKRLKKVWKKPFKYKKQKKRNLLVIHATNTDGSSAGWKKLLEISYWLNKKENEQRKNTT